MLNARGVRAGETHAASDFALFEVQMTLSEEGDAHTSEIILGARSRGESDVSDDDKRQWSQLRPRQQSPEHLQGYL